MSFKPSTTTKAPSGRVSSANQVNDLMQKLGLDDKQSLPPGSDADLDVAAQDLDQEQKAQPMALDLIYQRCLPKELINSGDDAAITAALASLTHLYLDGLGLSSIDGHALSRVPQLSHLYLQRNCLQRIENLEMLSDSLEFLALFQNQIRTIENLSHLEQLVFLDLSDNLIDEFDPDELPPNLRAINLHGNPCALRDDYLPLLVGGLPDLEIVDGQRLTKAQRKHYLEEAERLNKDPVRFVCDGCGTLLSEGNHFHCLDCENYDLCTACKNQQALASSLAPSSLHLPSHEMEPWSYEEDDDDDDDDDQDDNQDDASDYKDSASASTSTAPSLNRLPSHLLTSSAEASPATHPEEALLALQELSQEMVQRSRERMREFDEASIKDAARLAAQNMPKFDP